MLVVIGKSQIWLFMPNNTRCIYFSLPQLLVFFF